MSHRRETETGVAIRGPARAAVDGLVAGAVAGAASGAPSTLHAMAAKRGVLDAVRAAGTLLLPEGSAAGRLLVAGALAHTAISLWWGVVLGLALPRRRAWAWGTGAGLLIAALDLGVLGRRRPAIRSLPLVPQVADHVAFGALAGAVLAARARVAGGFPGSVRQWRGFDG